MMVSNYYSNIELDFQHIKSFVKNKDVVKGVSDLVMENKELYRKIERYKSLEANMLTSELLDKKQEINNVKVIAEKVNVKSSVMKDISFKLKKSELNLVMMLVSENNGKVVITIMITDDLVEKGIHAGNLIREVSNEVDGRRWGSTLFAREGLILQEFLRHQYKSLNN